LRTTPARKPRTECCCQSVAVTIDAIVAPVDDRSIETMWACLVAGRAAVLGDAGADRGRGLGLLVFRVDERVAAFVFDLGLVMGSSEVYATVVRRTTLAPPGQNTPAGQDPKRALGAPSHHSNAPIKRESQSFLSKIAAH
jgi:hypothetical protein